MTLLKTLAMLAAAVCAAAAHAQAFPIRPITIVVPFAPGGTSDIAARLVAQKVSESVGQQVIVENRGGANGQTAIAAVKQLPADGYTVLWTSIGMQAINPWIFSKLNYDPQKDFEPITATFTSTHFLLVPAASPDKSVADLVKRAKANPGKLTFASVGIGSGSHLVAEMFKQHAGIEVAHVPYKGSTSALPDVVGGRVDFFFDGPTSAPLVREGKLRALGTTDVKRHAVHPDVPTMAETGFPGIELNAWFGFVVLAGTPRPVIDKLNAEFVKALRHPEVAQKIVDFGGSVIAGKPAEFAALIASEHQRLGKVVKLSGAKAD